MSKRVFLIVLDSFGIGAEPDADLFGDVGTILWAQFQNKKNLSPQICKSWVCSILTVWK